MEEKAHPHRKVTNLGYLDELSKGDPEFVKQMIRIFLEENPREIKMLEEGIRNKDMSAINMAAHKLRSTLPFVGIDAHVAKEIEEIEAIAVDGSAVQKLEIAADGEENHRKIEVVTTDVSVLQKINDLFPKIKKVCEMAQEELKA
jgi:HPt (histidine-containing phosphotransfer) domain-containing protein